MLTALNTDGVQPLTFATVQASQMLEEHEQELAHAEKVIKTIQGEGFWDGRIHNG